MTRCLWPDAVAPTARCEHPPLPFSAKIRAGLARCAAVAVIAATLWPAAPEARAGAMPSPSNADAYAGFVAEAGLRFGIPQAWIRAVLKVESAGDARAVSSAGAMGLMQIMPETWSALRSQYGLGGDPFDPRDNILAGAAYLRDLNDRYGAPGFLAAYNAGPERFEEYLVAGRPLPPETVAYLAAVAPLLGGDTPTGAVAVAPAESVWIDAPLFVGHAHGGGMPLPSPSGQPDRGPASQDLTSLAPLGRGLFVPRSRPSDALP